jgi:hypothetical protein
MRCAILQESKKIAQSIANFSAVTRSTARIHQNGNADPVFGGTEAHAEILSGK